MGGFGWHDRLWPYLRGDDVGHVCGEEGDRREWMDEWMNALNMLNIFRHFSTAGRDTHCVTIV